MAVLMRLPRRRSTASGDGAFVTWGLAASNAPVASWKGARRLRSKADAAERRAKVVAKAALDGMDIQDRAIVILFLLGFWGSRNPVEEAHQTPERVGVKACQDHRPFPRQGREDSAVFNQSASR